jgi:hypothetical protein
VIGVDEHRWSHTPHTDGFVTVIIDLTPARDGPGRARCSTWFPGARPSADLVGDAVTGHARPG